MIRIERDLLYNKVPFIVGINYDFSKLYPMICFLI